MESDQEVIITYHAFIGELDGVMTFHDPYYEYEKFITSFV